jgi:iron complex transport system ATP-binding protein
MLAATDLRVTLGGRAVLDGVSLAVRPGEVLAVLGPNGAGKSTLLRAFSGLLRPQTGAVSLDGRALRDWTPRELARRRAVLPQEAQLAFPFRVHEVVMLGRTPHAGACRPSDHLRAIDAAMRAADIAVLADRPYPTLSGGERQRVQLARALAQIWRPDGPYAPASPGARYLLLDEPTNNLDLRHQDEVLATARRLAADGVGVLAILHDINLAAAFADRICLLKQGRIVAEGPAMAIIAEAPLAETFDVSVTVLRHPALPVPHIAWAAKRTGAGSVRD